ncbi:MAG: ABC transporter ATP-binding protein/permease [Neomegalonema sp.]|nr:ABC transporter ATP-binding protein/permease [Neomegalonema sp.]
MARDRRGAAFSPGARPDAPTPGFAGAWAIVCRVAPYLWPRGAQYRDIRIRVVGAMALLVLAKVATVSTPFLFKAAVDALAEEKDATAWLAIGPVALVLAYGAMRLCGVGFQQLRDAVFAKVGQQALRRLALQTFRHIHAMSLRYHLERRTGALTRVIDRGVKAIEFVLRFLLFSIAPLILELGLVAIILFIAFDWRFFAIVLVTIALYVVFTFRVTEWRVQIRRRMNEQDMAASQKAVDSLLNYETVKYFGAEEREAERYETSMRGYEGAVIKSQVSLALLNGGQAFIVTCGLAALMALAAVGVANGSLTVGDFVMVNAYMIQVMLPLNFLGTVYRELRQSFIDMADMFELIDRTPEIRDKPNAPTLLIRDAGVRFDRVQFHYDPERPILQEVSFDLAGGRRLALVGASGAGKSTIARLLYRFYDVSGGAILIDGQDLREVSQGSLRRQIGVVPQDTVLFNDTIGYNIAYARPEADRDEVVAAAKAARIHEFVEALPQGYDTMVGERGLKLSGGEKQRVAIARTILKNPPILIFDEATSALDTATEAAIQERLAELGRDRTVIAIAHRLSTIVDADEILVLDAGRVVERGAHAQLVAAGGAYAALWARQSNDRRTAAE